MKKILVTGASGQIGTELVKALRRKFGNENVIASGIRTQPPFNQQGDGPLLFIDVRYKQQIDEAVYIYDIDTIYHLASILSATGEKNPQLAYEVNMQGFYNVLEVARERKLERVMWPSSIAAFGDKTPLEKTPNDTLMRPSTMYGITKVAGELLAEYYFYRFEVDTRMIRFPGIISSEMLPGGGTTDYAVEIFYDAIKKNHYTCYVNEDTVLPFLYMPDAIRGLMNLAQAPLSTLTHRTFNLTGMSFSVKELAASIQKYIPEFTIDYKPDYRQAIADSWPRSLDDTVARTEWGWNPTYDLPKMTEDMISKLRKKLNLP
ncbi:MAG: NAD-dependent epimerase/dehydratase family protein [Candidatus Ranarchaeia archaeon]|jgi:nucleoside-diphosphate-sugar epimerase